MAYVNLIHMPKAKTEYSVNFTALNGGLNFNELDYRLRLNESPMMQNLIWREGVLGSRDGQVWVCQDETLGLGYTVYDRLFHGRLFVHCDSHILFVDPHSEEPEYEVLDCEVPENRGTFFQYQDRLYYKNRGGYIRIEYAADEDTFYAAPVVGYTPVILLNSDPDEAGSGDLYQPENRLQSKKTVRFNAKEGVTAYHLPVQYLDSVSSVEVDGIEKTLGTDYTVDLAAGVVNFVSAPPVTTPPTNNTVVITYDKENRDAYNSVMDCTYAVTYGGTGELCVVFGGCPAQPNAFFWNGNNIAMDATYFPFSQYQLVGGTDDPITGFGLQQSYLVVFKHHSVGRAKMNTTELDGRYTIEMPYVAINDKTGCDLPWTIQLIDNNLVWCNTEQGVHVLKDSSFAYENNIMCISTKVNGSLTRPGLLDDVRRGAVACSLDDSKHYWVCSNGHAWVWDYENTPYKEPSWYYYTNIKAIAFATELDDVWHMNQLGWITHMLRCFSDYSAPIDKIYRFAPQYFGGYDNLKNVNSVLIVMRSDTNTVTTLQYITDYEQRTDLTPLETLVWRMTPRNLAYRSLKARGFGAVFRRKPMCRRVKHFTMQLSNNRTGEDLSIVSAQILYNYQGRLR